MKAQGLWRVARNNVLNKRTSGVSVIASVSETCVYFVTVYGTKCGGSSQEEIQYFRD